MRGRPKKSWDDVVKEDIKKRGLCINDTQDRNKRRRCCKRVVDPGYMGIRSVVKAKRRKRL